MAPVETRIASRRANTVGHKSPAVIAARLLQRISPAADTF